MVVVARVSFSRRYITQAVTAYTGLPPIPPGVKRHGPFFRSNADTVHALTVYDIPEDGAAELLPRLRERYVCFAAIPDFSSDLQEWREFREFLAVWVE